MNDETSGSKVGDPRPASPALENPPSRPPTLRDHALTLPPTLVAAWAIGGSIILGLGSIGPWATADVFGISASASGLNGWGWLTLVTAILGGIAVLDPRWLSGAPWLHSRRLEIWLVLLLLSLLACVIKYVDLESSGLAGIINPGWGLDVAAAAVVVGIGVAYVLRLQAQQPHR